MYQIDYGNKIHIHFIGIGGISMSGIAELLLTEGFTISGSDMKKSAVTEHLESLGIPVIYGQTAGNITPGIDLVVYTAAVHPGNPEYDAAAAAGIPMIDRAECLGQIMRHYPNAVGVAGTHGKTTTTSMLSTIYLEADLDPTISVGGIMPGINGNMRVGHSEHFITEACEYTNSFLHFAPTTDIILNIEPEHLDFFKDLDDERRSFMRYIELLPEDGLLVINGEIENLEELTSHSRAKVVTYGLPAEGETFVPYDYTAENITYDEDGRGSYDLIAFGENLGRIKLGVVGRHNVSNSLAAIAAAMAPNSVNPDGISLDVIAEALTKYTGTDRRFQKKGTYKEAVVIDDYAHHPTEIDATLKAAKRVKHDRLVLAFQPHLYSRTKLLFNDFVRVLGQADLIVLADIYAAREKDPGDISSKDLADALVKKGANALYLGALSEVKNYLINNLLPGDLLITMGAGDIVKVGEELVSLS